MVDGFPKRTAPAEKNAFQGGVKGTPELDTINWRSPISGRRDVGGFTS